MADVSLLQVQICYASPEAQILHDFTVEQGTTLQQAILDSGLLRQQNGIDLAACRVGIFGKLKTPDTLLRDGDRIEIYRPLIADPMDSRRARMEKSSRESR
ncbi:RnfH family protein [Herbaspirillum sp. RTI4]|uniref:RnfH family protein n=1 Tax=Herbaspirillum sp. RTI4 TaxID=3048640 RepID=UPI002AB5328B|nr:RnfH family protein [Herbaspirillum sp. RTI4]MDY7578712.1 RnfH family protein [Herbaspirillum sp. RTI4]MEA9980590.1 RnfH family protein [Herbaspirillum sp. RTI4]